MRGENRLLWRLTPLPLLLLARVSVLPRIFGIPRPDTRAKQAHRAARRLEGSGIDMGRSKHRAVKAQAKRWTSDVQRALGIVVRRCREERRMTQQALAAGAGISVAHLCKIERGQTNPTWRSVAMIAAGLGMPVAELARQWELIGGD